MRLKVENFGPIVNADIEIKPLTVIIGKNNAGKSMLAQLIFTLLALTEARLPRRHFLSMIRYARQRDIVIIPRISSITFDFEDFEKRVKGLKEITPYSITKTIINTIIDNSTQPLHDTLRSLLEQNFAIELRDLINLNSDYAKVECTYFEYSTIKFIIAKDSSLSFKFDIKIEELIEHILKNKAISKDINRYIDFMKERIPESRKSSSYFTLTPLVGKISEFIFPERVLRSSLYIPAGRAGLLEGYEAVSSALIALAPTAPLRGISMPPIPGMASEFYSVIMLRLEGREGPFAKIAESFKEVIEGDISFEKLKAPKGKSKMVYKFKFKDKEATMDLIHAASMIKELAPIYLVVKELIDKGYTLIIEEPESHLHPAAQIKLMEIFAKLVNEGLNIIITTHSDLLLRKLAHLIMEASNESKADVFLKPEDVAVYLLKSNEGGYVSQKVNILEEMPTFDEVIQQLYEEERNLYFSLQKEEE